MTAAVAMRNVFPTDFTITPALPSTSPSFGNGYKVQSSGFDRSLRMFGGYTRFEVRPGDHWSQDVTNNNGYTGLGIHERSELTAPGSTRFLSLDTDNWLSFAMRISANSAPTPYSSAEGSEFCIVGQVHSTDTPDGGLGTNPLPFVQSLDTSGSLLVQTRSSLAANPNIPVTRATLSVSDQAWHNIVHHLVFYNATSTGAGTGKLETWLDGVQVYSQDGIQMGSAQTSPPYFKFGIYRSTSTSTSIVEYANPEASSGTSLLGRVTTPLAHP